MLEVLDTASPATVTVETPVPGVNGLGPIAIKSSGGAFIDLSVFSGSIVIDSAFIEVDTEGDVATISRALHFGATGLAAIDLGPSGPSLYAIVDNDGGSCQLIEEISDGAFFDQKFLMKATEGLYVRPPRTGSDR
jgi:hypothetical protein